MVNDVFMATTSSSDIPRSTAGDEELVASIDTETEQESPNAGVRIKDRELRPYSSLMLDDARKNRIFEGLTMNVKRRAGDVRASLKGIMNDLVDEVIRDHHLLPDEFLDLLERGDAADGSSSNKLIRDLLESFFGGLQERRSHRFNEEGGITGELPFKAEGDNQEQVEGAKREFGEFIDVYGTEREERKVFEIIEKLQEKYPNIDVIDVIKGDRDIMEDLTERIAQETRDICTAKFEEAFKKNRTILDFLFERVLGEQGDKILTLEGPRKQLIEYLEKIGFRLENLDRLLSLQPVFKVREERQKVRRQQRVKSQEALGEPKFGVTNGNSFHSWFARHFIKDIREQRDPKFKMDLAETTMVSMKSMSRIIVPKAEMLVPIRMLVEEAKGGEKKLLWRMELDNVPVAEARKIIGREIEEGKKTIDKIKDEALHFVPDAVPEKQMAVYIPTIENERNIKNLLAWCENPSLFMEDNPEARKWIADTYQLHEYAANAEDLDGMIERIVGYQARTMLEFWYKSHDMLPGGDTKELEERTAAFEARFRERFGIVPEEIVPVKLRWRVLQEVDESGKPVLRDFMRAKVPTYKYHEVKDGEEDDGEEKPLSQIDGKWYQVKKIEEVTLYEVTLHHQDEPLTVYFFSPNFEKNGMLWNSKTFQSRVVSQLRQGEREVTDGTRTCIAVKGSAHRQRRRALDFVFNEIGGTTVKVEDPSNNRLKKKERPSVTAILSAHHRAGQRGSRHHIRTKDGKMVTETVEVQLYTIENLCIGWLSQETVMSHDVYDADRSLGLFRDVLFPGLIFPAMRDFNNEIPKYKPQMK
ncbi:MAG: hypothetical protein NTX63_01130 [Candidatus Peregrinibacteria bacterium]|nr:hypothetical protein [Candidatus Peregrinibacteria bacterium]